MTTASSTRAEPGMEAVRTGSDEPRLESATSLFEGAAPPPVSVPLPGGPVPERSQMTSSVFDPTCDVPCGGEGVRKGQ